MSLFVNFVCLLEHHKPRSSTPTTWTTAFDAEAMTNHRPPPAFPKQGGDIQNSMLLEAFALEVLSRPVRLPHVLVIMAGNAKNTLK